MAAGAVFDTNILIDYLQGNPLAEIELQRHTRRCISLVTWIEVLVGARSSQQEILWREFLSKFEVLPLDFVVAEAVISLRRPLGRLKLPDALIQASAQVANCILVTRDTTAFPPGTAGVRIPY